MKINNYKVSITIFGGLLVTSFVPFIQVILMYRNGGILALTEDLIRFDALDIAVPLNLIMTFIALFLYFKSKTRFMKALTGIITAFVINGTVVFGFEKVLSNSDANFYALQFIVGAVLTGVGLLGIDTISMRKANK